MSEKKSSKKPTQYLGRDHAEAVSLMVRVDAKMRKRVHSAASAAGVSVNRWINGLITRALKT